MKILVFQSHIGPGSLTWEHGDNYLESNRIIIEKCMKSVSDWCLKQGFELQIATKDLGWSINFNSKNDTQLNKMLQNWEHIPKRGYDYIIYFDNDIFIIDQDAIPPVVDFGMVPRFGDQVLFAEHYFGKNTLWFNAGVTFMSLERCKHFSEWMLSKIKSQKKSELFLNLPREESLTTEYCSQFNPTVLDYCWNTMPPQTPEPAFKITKFLHLLGPDKEKTLKICPKYIQEQVIDYETQNSIALEIA